VIVVEIENDVLDQGGKQYYDLMTVKSKMVKMNSNQDSSLKPSLVQL